MSTMLLDRELAGAGRGRKCRRRWAASRRLAGVAPLVIMLAAFAAAPAARAATATTVGDDEIAPTSAQVFGLVQTDGLQTTYAFQFGPTTSYSGTSVVGVLPAGEGVVEVSARLTGLRPDTAYHFRLDAVNYPRTATGTYDAAPSFGRDLTLTTISFGTVTVFGGHLLVRHHSIAPPISCSGPVACAGTLTITLTVKRVTHTCARPAFSLKAGELRKVRSELSDTCIRLLRAAGRHKVRAKLVASPTTGQPGASAVVNLYFKS
jgi:hypothetical protein